MTSVAALTLPRTVLSATATRQRTTLEDVIGHWKRRPAAAAAASPSVSATSSSSSFIQRDAVALAAFEASIDTLSDAIALLDGSPTVSSTQTLFIPTAQHNAPSMAKSATGTLLAQLAMEMAKVVGGDAIARRGGRLITAMCEYRGGLASRTGAKGGLVAAPPSTHHDVAVAAFRLAARHFVRLAGATLFDVRHAHLNVTLVEWVERSLSLAASSSTRADSAAAAPATATTTSATTTSATAVHPTLIHSSLVDDVAIAVLCLEFMAHSLHAAAIPAPSSSSANRPGASSSTSANPHRSQRADLLDVSDAEFTLLPASWVKREVVEHALAADRAFSRDQRQRLGDYLDRLERFQRAVSAAFAGPPSRGPRPPHDEAHRSHHHDPHDVERDQHHEQPTSITSQHHPLSRAVSHVPQPTPPSPAASKSAPGSIPTTPDDHQDQQRHDASSDGIISRSPPHGDIDSTVVIDSVLSSADGRLAALSDNALISREELHAFLRGCVEDHIRQRRQTVAS